MGNDEWMRQTLSGGGGNVSSRLSTQGVAHRTARASVFGTEALEWAQSVFLLVLGALILSHPRIATGSILVVTFRVLQGYGTGLFLLGLGILGVLTLIRNGGPIWRRVRVACSMIRSLTWLSFVLSMSFLTVDVGHISPMMVAYSAYAVGEVAVTYTLARHVRPS